MFSADAPSVEQISVSLPGQQQAIGEASAQTSGRNKHVAECLATRQENEGFFHRISIGIFYGTSPTSLVGLLAILLLTSISMSFCWDLSNNGD